MFFEANVVDPMEIYGNLWKSMESIEMNSKTIQNHRSMKINGNRNHGFDGNPFNSVVKPLKSIDLMEIRAWRADAGGCGRMQAGAGGCGRNGRAGRSGGTVGQREPLLRRLTGMSAV